MNLFSIHFSLRPPLSRPFCNVCNANAEDEVQPNAKALLESYSNLDILRYGQGTDDEDQLMKYVLSVCAPRARYV